jgi:hypothetical protein
MEIVARDLSRTAVTRLEHSQTGLPAAHEPALLILTVDRMNSMIAMDGLSGLRDQCWHHWMMPSVHDTVRMI